jgi:hypothetical protein
MDSSAIPWGKYAERMSLKVTYLDRYPKIEAAKPAQFPGAAYSKRVIS